VNIFETKSKPGAAHKQWVLALPLHLRSRLRPELQSMLAKRCILRQIVGAHTVGLDDF
jgi:hypothetical protein